MCSRFNLGVHCMENAKESPEGFIQEHNCEAKALPLYEIWLALPSAGHEEVSIPHTENPFSQVPRKGEEQRKTIKVPLLSSGIHPDMGGPLTWMDPSSHSQRSQVIFTKCSVPLGPNGPLHPRSLTGNQSSVSFVLWMLQMSIR